MSVFEAQADWITSELDKLAQSFGAANPHDLEFHASTIFSRRQHPWDGLSRDEARGAIKAAMAFEEFCNRFDRYLSRLRVAGDRQRGLVILDQSAHETSLQAMARQFRRLGTAWGVVRNLADTPLFIDSRASRMVQLADHVAYAVFRRYEHGDSQYFDVVASRFDSADGVVHGLVHRQNIDPRCMCLACVTRRP